MVVLEFAVWRQPPAGASRLEVDFSATAEECPKLVRFV
jgi:hypothetical protein